MGSSWSGGVMLIDLTLDYGFFSSDSCLLFFYFRHLYFSQRSLRLCGDFHNPHSLAQTFFNTIKVSPDPVYKVINIVLWAPSRQGGPQSKIRTVELLTPVFSIFYINNLAIKNG
jgi:hypothetical protein